MYVEGSGKDVILSLNHPGDHLVAPVITQYLSRTAAAWMMARLGVWDRDLANSPVKVRIAADAVEPLLKSFDCEWKALIDPESVGGARSEKLDALCFAGAAVARYMEQRAEQVQTVTELPIGSYAPSLLLTEPGVG